MLYFYWSIVHINYTISMLQHSNITLYTLQIQHHNKSSKYLSSYKVPEILTVFLIFYIITYDLFILNWNFVPNLSVFVFFPEHCHTVITAVSCGHHQFVLRIYESVPVQFVHLFCFLRCHI